MGCFVALFALALPRVTLVFLWLFTNWLTVAMPSFIVGFLGFLLLPYTTVLYTLAYSPGVGVHGFGWAIVGVGVLLDLSSHFGGERQRRNRYA